jgi:hypothetical protein
MGSSSGAETPAEAAQSMCQTSSALAALFEASFAYYRLRA